MIRVRRRVLYACMWESAYIHRRGGLHLRLFPYLPIHILHTQTGSTILSAPTAITRDLPLCDTRGRTYIIIYHFRFFFSRFYRQPPPTPPSLSPTDIVNISFGISSETYFRYLLYVIITRYINTPQIFWCYTFYINVL